MWILTIKNASEGIQISQKYPSYTSAEKDFLYDLKVCRDADMLIKFSYNDNKIKRKEGIVFLLMFVAYYSYVIFG